MIAKAWTLCKLSAGKVAKEAKKLGLHVPARCGLQQTLCQFGRQLLSGEFVK